MIILIGGPGSVGKTNLAHEIMVDYHINYLSIDHIKMGMIRGLDSPGFTAIDSDDVISGEIYPVVEGIIRTNLENKQDIIIEGCYLPVDKVKDLILEYPGQIVSIYLCFSEDYIKNNYDLIIEKRNVIEKRLYEEDRTMNEMIIENKNFKNKFIENQMIYYEIENNYEREMEVLKDLIKEYLYE